MKETEGIKSPLPTGPSSSLDEQLDPFVGRTPGGRPGMTTMKPCDKRKGERGSTPVLERQPSKHFAPDSGADNARKETRDQSDT